MTTQDRNNLYKKEHGLTDFGKVALKEMQKLNMVCDLSHANDATFWQALELTQGKFCVTHSNCAALCPHTRNLTDEMMKALADADGVMGLCFFGEFIDSRKPSLEKFVQHILHALEMMGPDHVGIGSDYDGVGPDDFMAIAHPGLMHNLWAALAKAGVDDLTLSKVAHGNFLKLLDDTTNIN
jgi:membrane dipeptidase